MLDIARNSGNGATGADARHQYIDPAIGVIPDFRAGGLFVNRRVGRVFKLLGHKIIERIAGQNFGGLVDGAFHALGRLGQDQFGPQSLEYLAPLKTHR